MRPRLELRLGLELRQRPGLPGQFAAFRRRREGGEHLGYRLPPGGVIVPQRIPVQRSMIERAAIQRSPVQRTPVQQRVKGPLHAGTARPADPLVFRHAAFETTRQPDALHDASPRVMRPQGLTARIRA
jgi:hypothetical protein